MGGTNSTEEETAARRRAEAERARQEEYMVNMKLRAEREYNSRLQDEILNKQRLIDRQAEQIKAQQIQTDRIKAQQIQADRIKAEQILADQIKAQQIQADQIKAQQIQADQIKAQQIQADQIKAQLNQNEQIIRELCPNARFGCTSPVPYHELLAHSKACLYRRLKCPMKPCSWQGIYNELYCHAEEAHTTFTGMHFGQHCRVLLGPDTMLLTIRGLVFKFYARPTSPRLTMCWALQLLGPPAEAANWKYEIQINKAGDRVKRLQMSDMCLHEDEDVDKVLNEGRCPSAAFKILGNFLQKNRIGFKLNVYNKSQLEQPKSDGVE